MVSGHCGIGWRGSTARDRTAETRDSIVPPGTVVPVTADPLVNAMKEFLVAQANMLAVKMQVMSAQ